MAVLTATLPRPALQKRPLPQRAIRALTGILIGYLVLWAIGAGGILGLSFWAKAETPAPAGTRTVQGVHNFQPVSSDGKLWRGAAPSPAGYRALASMGITTVVDLRAEDLSANQLAGPGKAGLDVVRLPIRDGQTPTSQQVQKLLDTVKNASGPVFVHCGAGVGRTGAMAAAYLVQTGEESSAQAVRRNLAVGPPSIEQIYYGLNLSPSEVEQPPLPVVVVSRLVDAPRRIASWF
ncbi:dual specificity protein phosphatase family protein [Streptomyces cinnabarinus]|uniref:Dual specificity protein phosphatase family protein n=1 Tax=Streptomyces cinnabarinus TaxID=67287 RepID=A0ABY7K912_9ACTN|nr:dual specificity protein phosphatase family protein [Streptomyces cinnabarinus]WAZ21001.1 dual specificity protein phosphatase family protein [Streptomyces cinnabarinus]